MIIFLAFLLLAYALCGGIFGFNGKVIFVGVLILCYCLLFLIEFAFMRMERNVPDNERVICPTDWGFAITQTLVQVLCIFAAPLGIELFVASKPIHWNTSIEWYHLAAAFAGYFIALGIRRHFFRQHVCKRCGAKTQLKSESTILLFCPKCETHWDTRQNALP